MLSKEWLLLSNDMELVCLRIAAGLTKPVAERDVQALLLASNCRRYQPLPDGIKQAISLLNALLTNPAAPVPTHPIPVGKRQDARLAVIVEKDRMSATAQITADWGGLYVTHEQLQEAISLSDIKQGVSEQLLTAAILSAKEAAPGSQLKLVIARGQPAINGQDSRYERLVETPAERILKPRELDHDRVDLRDLGSIVTVKAGAPLMRRHPATQGVPGFTVTGQELPAKDGKDSPMSAGEGTFLSPDDPDLLIASRAGLPCQEKAGMKVDEVLSVKRVDARHGHIDFEGGLIVSGDVNPGMKISVSGDIVIGGFIEGGWIEAGGTITVRHGIIGRRDDQGEFLCKLNAQREIHASYAQYAQLEAGGDIQIQSQLSHCYSRSGQDIKVGDGGMRKGNLLGGLSIANRLIISPVLGASAGNQTRLQILGGYFTHKEQEHQLKQQQQACLEQLEKIKALVMRLVQLPSDKRNPDTLRKLKPIRERHQLELRQLEDQLAANREELQKLMADMDIIATQHLFPGVEVEMAHHHNRVDIEHGPIHFCIREDQLLMNPYKGHK
ncbi:FapA family protein [Aeromonas veronii]